MFLVYAMSRCPAAANAARTANAANILRKLHMLQVLRGCLNDLLVYMIVGGTETYD